MDFDRTNEQLELGRAVGRVIAGHADEEQRRIIYASKSGFDKALWQLMGTSMGLSGLTVPEEHGGSGAGMEELAVVLTELGRHLVSSPLFATAALAVTALRAAPPSEPAASLLRRIADGQAATWAQADVEGRAVVASEIDGQWRLLGSKRLVIDAGPASFLVVAGQTPSGRGIFAVDNTEGQVSVTPTRSIDPTRRLWQVEFDGAAGRMLSGPASTPAVLSAIDDAARIAISAESVGGAARCLDMSVRHAKDREQFGRPIGSFQAVKHHCANMLVRLECAQSTVDYAAWVYENNVEEVAALAPLAASVAVEAFLDIAKTTIQVHGGIGFTWEHNAHFYLKRAKSNALMFGNAVSQREVLATRLGLLAHEDHGRFGSGRFTTTPVRA